MLFKNYYGSHLLILEIKVIAQILYFDHMSLYPQEGGIALGTLGKLLPVPKCKV
jgi:hypothetical protein